MKKFPLLFIILTCLACGTEEKKLSADAIISKSIERSGGEKYERANIEFTFRDRHYTSTRSNGIFEFTRTSIDSLGKVRDILNNEGFTRTRGGEEIELVDSVATALAESVNSVHYFIQLPYGLNGPAVQKELVGRDSIKGKEYFEVKVTFKEQGGGIDHEDVYMYWIHTEDFTMDYLAYRFYVNDGGIRFRVGVNPRIVNGIRFLDYENYGWKDLTTPLNELDDLYEQGRLSKISQIENENIKVKIEEPSN